MRIFYLQGGIKMDIYERIKKIAETKGLSIKQLEKILDFSPNTLYKWKRQSPSIERVEKVATFFNISIDFLLGRTVDFDEELELRSELEEAAYENLSELLSYINDYYDLSQNGRNGNIEFTIQDRQTTKQIGAILSEHELLDDAGDILIKLQSIPPDLSIDYKKAILSSLFTSKPYRNELIKQVIKKVGTISSEIDLLHELSYSDGRYIFVNIDVSYAISFANIYFKPSIREEYDFLLPTMIHFIDHSTEEETKTYFDLFIKLESEDTISIHPPYNSYFDNFSNEEAFPSIDINTLFRNLKTTTVKYLQENSNKIPIDPYLIKRVEISNNK